MAERVSGETAWVMWGGRELNYPAVSSSVARVADNPGMALITVSNAHLAYGHVPLLDGTALSLEAGERVALIGRNGAGKSSLLKILAGLEKADEGILQLLTGLRRVYVAQEPLFEAGVSVFDAVSVGVAEARALREKGDRLGRKCPFLSPNLGRSEA